MLPGGALRPPAPTWLRHWLGVHCLSFIIFFRDTQFGWISRKSVSEDFNYIYKEITLATSAAFE